MKNKILSGCILLAAFAIMHSFTLASEQSPAGGKVLNEELLRAITKKDVKAVQGLLERGASSDYQMPSNEGGGTPLMLASLLGNAEIVALLLKRGADAGSLDELGRSAVWFSVTQGDVETLKILSSDAKAINTVNMPEMRTKFTALQVATDREDAAMTEILLKMGANPDLKNTFGQSTRSLCRSRKDAACTLVNRR